MLIRDQGLVLQGLSLEQSDQRVTEQKRIVAVVEPKGHFVQPTDMARPPTA